MYGSPFSLAKGRDRIRGYGADTSVHTTARRHTNATRFGRYEVTARWRQREDLAWIEPKPKTFEARPQPTADVLAEQMGRAFCLSLFCSCSPSVFHFFSAPSAPVRPAFQTCWPLSSAFLFLSFQRACALEMHSYGERMCISHELSVNTHCFGYGPCSLSPFLYPPPNTGGAAALFPSNQGSCVLRSWPTTLVLLLVSIFCSPFVFLVVSP